MRLAAVCVKLNENHCIFHIVLIFSLFWWLTILYCVGVDVYGMDNQYEAKNMCIVRRLHGNGQSDFHFLKRTDFHIVHNQRSNGSWGSNKVCSVYTYRCLIVDTLNAGSVSPPTICIHISIRRSCVTRTDKATILVNTRQQHFLFSISRKIKITYYAVWGQNHPCPQCTKGHFSNESNKSPFFQSFVLNRD